MSPKELYDFLFKLYDYADYLAEEIKPGNYDNKNYYMSMIYIEEIMDSYGRGLINSAAHQLDENDRDSLREAHKRIDALRQKIYDLKQSYDFEDVVAGKTEKLTRDWGFKKP